MTKEKISETLSKTGDVLTQKPVKIEITVKPKNFLMRFFIRIKIVSNIHVFELKPIVVGNMFRIASKVVQVPDDLLDKSVLHVLMNGVYDHLDKVIYIVACALQNDRNEPKESLLDLIRNEFTAKDLANVLQAVMLQMNAEDFINSIVLIKGLNVLNVPELDAMHASLPE